MRNHFVPTNVKQNVVQLVKKLRENTNEPLEERKKLYDILVGISLVFWGMQFPDEDLLFVCTQVDRQFYKNTYGEQTDDEYDRFRRSTIAKTRAFIYLATK